MSFTQPRLHHHQVRYVIISTVHMYAQSCYSVIGDKPFLNMEQAKIRPYVTLYSLNRSLSNLVLLIMSPPLLVQQFWLNLIGWGIPRKYVKYNLCVTFCSVPFFVHSSGAKTRERICTIEGSKRMKLGKDVPFVGFVKNYYPHPQYPPNLTGSSFMAVSVHAQYTIGKNYVKSWSNFRNFSTKNEIGHGEVKLFEVNFYTESSLMAVSAHAH